MNAETTKELHSASDQGQGTQPRFENGRFCCPACWVRRGLWMPFLEGKGCDCGYTYPKWVRTPLRAAQEAKVLMEQGSFDILDSPGCWPEDELVWGGSTNSWHYAGFKLQL